MSVPSQEMDPLDQDPGSRRSRHRRKKRHHRKFLRQIIIGVLFVLACVIALVLWHFLVQEPPARSTHAAPAGLGSIKA